MAANQRQEHGVPHQLNVYRKDRESPITRMGQHKRCLVLGDPLTGGVEVRVDSVCGDQDLPWPTLKQVLAMAMHPVWRMHLRATSLAFREVLEEQPPVAQVAGILQSKWYAFYAVGRRAP